jgi:Tat protein translocase TatB subunit
MFSGIGLWEVVIVIVVILIVLGPQRLPEMARKLGQAVRTLRKTSSDLTTAMSRELEFTDNNPPKKGVKEESTENSLSATSKVPPETEENPSADPGKAPPAK